MSKYKPYFPALAKCAPDSSFFNETISLANNNGETVCSHWRAYHHPDGMYPIIGATFILNSENKIILQKNSRYKRTDALKWTFSSGGHIDATETQEQGALRELLEEMGIKGVLDCKIGVYRNMRNGKPGAFYTVWLVRHNGPYQIDEQEADCIRAFTLDEVYGMVQKNPNDFKQPFVTAFLDFYKRRNEFGV